MIPRHRRRRPLGEHVLRGLIRATGVWVIAVCSLAEYVNANGRFLP